MEQRISLRLTPTHDNNLALFKIHLRHFLTCSSNRPTKAA